MSEGARNAIAENDALGLLSPGTINGELCWRVPGGRRLSWEAGLPLRDAIVAALEGDPRRLLTSDGRLTDVGLRWLNDYAAAAGPEFSPLRLETIAATTPES